MNKYNIVAMPEFKQTLRKILRYYSSLNFIYTLKIMYEINEMTKIIQTFPNVAQMLSNNSNIRKYIIKNRFSVIYRIKNNEIELLYFIDNRMQNDNYLAEEIVSTYQV